MEQRIWTVGCFGITSQPIYVAAITTYLYPVDFLTSVSSTVSTATLISCSDDRTNIVEASNSSPITRTCCPSAFFRHVKHVARHRR